MARSGQQTELIGKIMWHRISFVAESRNLPADELTAFAFAKVERYGLVVDRGSVEVSTWQADALIRDYMAQAAANNQEGKKSFRCIRF